MKTRHGYEAAYNVQTVVDSETHMITDFEVTSNCNDAGLLSVAMEDRREREPGTIISATADSGYLGMEDMVRCLEKGIIPNVIPKGGAETLDVEMEYREAADLNPASTEPEELEKCLHAGVVPDACRDCLELSIEDKEERVDVVTSSEEPELTREEMTARAAGGFFVRDPKENVVICPQGEVLTMRSHKDGVSTYTNAYACRKCPNRAKCTNFKTARDYRSIRLADGRNMSGCRMWQRATGWKCTNTRDGSHGHARLGKIVRGKFKPDPEKMKKRKSLSEHPFGAIKWSMGINHFLLRGRPKVTGEFALAATGYNLIRGRNMLGFEGMMAIVAGS